MSKYVELAIAANETDDIKVTAEKTAPILRAKVNAIISAQEAKVMELEADLAERDSDIKLARGLLTKEAKDWVANLNKTKDKYAVVAADLQEAMDYLDDLKEELKLFS